MTTGVNADLDRAIERERRRRDELNKYLNQGVKAFAGGAGKAIDEGMKVSRENEEREARNSYVRDMLQGNDPVSRAAADEYIRTGNANPILQRQMQLETMKAREAEKQARDDENRRKEEWAKTIEQGRLYDDYKDKLRRIDNSADPKDRVSRIADTIVAAQKAGVDTAELEGQLEYEQDRLQHEFNMKIVAKQKAEREAKEKERIELHRKEIEQYIAELDDDYPANDVDGYNTRIDNLKQYADKVGVNADTVKWPNYRKQPRTTRTAKEEDEFIALEARKRNPRLTMAIDDEHRYNQLAKMKPYKK